MRALSSDILVKYRICHGYVYVCGPEAYLQFSWDIVRTPEYRLGRLQVVRLCPLSLSCNAECCAQCVQVVSGLDGIGCDFASDNLDIANPDL